MQPLDVLAAMTQSPIRLLMPRLQEAPAQVPSSILMSSQQLLNKEGYN
jgi:hypothetical protein